MTMTSSFMSVVRTCAGLIAIVMASLLDKKVGASGSLLRCPMLPSDGRYGAAKEVGISHVARYPIDAALRTCGSCSALPWTSRSTGSACGARTDGADCDDGARGQCVPLLVVSMPLVSDPVTRRDGEWQRHHLSRELVVVGVDELDLHLVVAWRQPGHVDCIIVAGIRPPPGQVVDRYVQMPETWRYLEGARPEHRY